MPHRRGQQVVAINYHTSFARALPRFHLKPVRRPVAFPYDDAAGLSFKHIASSRRSLPPGPIPMIDGATMPLSFACYATPPSQIRADSDKQAAAR